MTDHSIEQLKGELEDKVQRLIKRERDFQGLVRQISLTNQWVELSAKITARIAAFIDESSALEALVEALAEDLGFEFAYARWDTTERQCPPLPPDALAIARSSSSFSCAEDVCLTQFTEGTLRIGYRLLIPSELSPGEIIVVVVGRSAQTASYFEGLDTEILMRLERLRELLCQSLDAVRLRRELVRERDLLQTAVEQRTQDLQRALVEAETARNEALRSAVARTQFLANMSHEIRTPMTAILGYAELLLERNTSPAMQLQHAGTIQRSARHLMQLLDDILNLARIESGKLELEVQEVELPRVFLDVHSLLSVRAKEKGLSLSVEFATPLPARACLDAARLRQIVINLVGNAIKFTERGSITLTVKFGPNNWLKVSVRDTGSGIAAGKLDEIFEAFEQENASTSRVHGGTGLGLAISRKLAHLMGGEIQVASEVGKGSCFELDVPIKPVGSNLVTTPDACTSDGPPAWGIRQWRGRVLVVEDTGVNREMFRMLLEASGLTVETAADGAEGLRAIDQAARSGRPFDMVFMDMQMPVLDGYEATRRLRASNLTLPVVALTAHSMEDDRERCLRAGCT